MRRILFTETDFNALPNPPAGFKYIGFDGPNFSEKDDTGSTTPTGGGGSFTEITYQELRDLQDGSELTPGGYYLISDFKTCYDQPDYETLYSAITVGNYKESEENPILVFAISVNELGSDAYQPNYPKDKIKYDVTFNQTEVTGGTAYGRITERIDEFGNRTDYDHREVLFKRYKQYYFELNNRLSGTVSIASTGVVTGTDSSFNSLSVGEVIAIPSDASLQIGAETYFSITEIVDDYTMSVTGSYIPSINDIEMYSTSNNGYVSFYRNNVDGNTDYVENKTFHEIDAYNNYFGDFANRKEYEGMNFLLANNVMKGGDCNDNKFGNMCFNNTFDDDCSGNKIGDWFNQNSTNDDFDNNEIGNYFNNNIINANFNYNRIGYNYYGNRIFSSSFYRNNIGNDFNNNFLSNSGYDFQNNEIGNQFQINTIEKDFYKNDIGNGFNNNVIKSQSYGNHIGNGFNNNNIYNYFNTNTIEDIFENNTIGNINQIESYDFSKNQIAWDAKGNIFIGDFTDNVVGSSFYSNEMLGDSYGNRIGSYFLGNDIETNFRSNNIMNNFYGNIISHNFGYNTIGNDFSNNTIENDFGFGSASPRGNKIGNRFQDNHVGEYFYDNNISDNFIGNTMSLNFQYNDVKAYVQYMDFTAYYGNILTFTYSFAGELPVDYDGVQVIGNTFSNVSGTYSYAGSTASVVDATFDIYVVDAGTLVVTLNNPGNFYLPSVGFTASAITISESKFANGYQYLEDALVIEITAVSDLPSVYAEYNTEIFKRAGGVNRLSYHDASDVLTITDIDK